MALRLDTFCCGCSLKAGTLYLLWIANLYGIAGIFIGGMFLVNNGCSNRTVCGISIGFILITSVISITFSSLGIYGVEKKQPHFLIPFIASLIIITTITTLALIIFCIAYAIVSDEWGKNQQNYHSTKYSVEIFSCGFFAVLSMVLGGYFITILCNFYCVMIEQKKIEDTKASAPLNQYEIQPQWNPAASA